jgi:hypothetical protein
MIVIRNGLILIILFIVIEFAFRIPKHCLSCPTEFSLLKDFLVLGSAAYLGLRANQINKQQTHK